MKSLVLLGGLILMPFRLMAADAKKPEILVAAAASLRDAFEEIAPVFEQAHPAAKVTFQFAASGALQQQIEQGAPVDLFVSAAQKQVDALLQKDLLVKDSVQNLCSNALVLIIPKDKTMPQSIQDLRNAAYRRIAIGEKATVPAGQYAEQWIEKSGLSALKERLVPASNVRQVLSFVETGNADAGFVYKTDALTSRAVVVALQAAAKDHDAITYPLALVKKSSQRDAAQAFAKFLKSDTARRILEKRGFMLPAEKAS
jgi:molybdate transport system substrate-binding protein